MKKGTGKAARFLTSIERGGRAFAGKILEIREVEEKAAGFLDDLLARY